MTLSFKDRGTLLLGQWFFTGRSPVAPGTAGSLGTLPLFFLCRSLPGWAYWLVTAAIALGGIAIGSRCAELLQDEDPPSVVIDEVAGVMIALGWVAHAQPWQWLVAWSLFRLLDITKPWLIHDAQDLSPPGLGIMADDILAGLVAGVSAVGLPFVARYMSP
jgi:phosphatidylglycerophosphatase A